MVSGSYLIDTDVLVDQLKHVPRAVSALKRLITKGKFFCSVINEAEVLAGMREDERDRVEALFDALCPLDVTREIAQLAGRYRREYHKSHGVQITDALIAATASIHDLVLITLNEKHFPMSEVTVKVPYSTKD
jgi:predicted nucleic acid-binding protein